MQNLISALSSRSLFGFEEVIKTKKRKVLGVHIEGENKFSMYKQWGEGNQKLLPIYPEYADTIIRWGKDEPEEAIINKNKRYNARQFLY
jgi:hypothetical protein